MWPGQQAGASPAAEAEEVLTPGPGGCQPPPPPPPLASTPAGRHGKPSPAQQLTSSCVMENEGDEDRKLPPGIWGLSGGTLRLEAGRGHGAVTQGRWAAGREGLKEAEEGAQGLRLGGGGRCQAPEAWEAATPGPGLLSIFQKETKGLEPATLPVMRTQIK